MIYFLLLTALTVSIDSFVCGFTLSLRSDKKLPIILGITLTVFIMCALTNYLTAFLAEKINEKTACVGGLILVAVGVYNLIKKPNANGDKNYCYGLKLAIITGLAVGIDGALANLSLSLMGINDFFVPVIIALMHGVMISLGVCLAKNTLAQKFAKIEFFPPLILILLGGYKLLGLFI